MTFKEYLKSLELEDEQIEKIVSGMSEQSLYISNEEHIDDRYAKLKAQKEAVDDQLEKANDTIGTLKSENKTNEELQTKINDYEAEITSLKENSARIMKDSAVDVALIKNGAKNAKAVKALLDMEKVEMTEDGVTGLDEQLETLKENDAYLFQSADENNNPTILNGEEPNGSGGEDDTDAFDEVMAKY